jgi:hypothetical protein
VVAGWCWSECGRALGKVVRIASSAMELISGGMGRVLEGVVCGRIVGNPCKSGWFGYSG